MTIILRKSKYDAECKVFGFLCELGTDSTEICIIIAKK